MTIHLFYEIMFLFSAGYIVTFVMMLMILFFPIPFIQKVEIDFQYVDVSEGEA